MGQITRPQSLGAANLAAPSALVGLTSVPGSALTAMRSDAAPALDQSIAPTWTNMHTFSRTGSGNRVNLFNPGNDYTSLIFRGGVAPVTGLEVAYSPPGAAFEPGYAWMYSVTGVGQVFYAGDKVAHRVAVSGGSISAMDFGNATDNPPYTFIGAHNNAGGNLRSGTYTPVLTLGSNAQAATAYLCQWMRVGNVCSVSGKFDLDATVAITQTILDLSLPIASAFTQEEQLGGSASSYSQGTTGGFRANAVSDRATFSCNDPTGTNQSFYFTYQYLIL